MINLCLNNQILSTLSQNLNKFSINNSDISLTVYLQLISIFGVKIMQIYLKLVMYFLAKRKLIIFLPQEKYFLFAYLELRLEKMFKTSEFELEKHYF